MKVKLVNPNSQFAECDARRFFTDETPELKPYGLTWVFAEFEESSIAPTVANFQAGCFMVYCEEPL